MHLTIPYAIFDTAVHCGTWQICPFGIELSKNTLYLHYLLMSKIIASSMNRFQLAKPKCSR